MCSIFVDTSVLISALLSHSGASHLLLGKARLGEITLYSNDFSIKELHLTAARYQLLVPKDFFNIFTIQLAPSVETISWVRPQLLADPKDILIVAGAIESHAKYLATFDRKHINVNGEIRFAV